MLASDRIRLFIGTALDPELAFDVERRAGHALVDPAWRVAPMEQWHVTALFIGERPSDQLDRIVQKVPEVASSFDPIVLRDGRLLTMPPSDPAMLWVRFEPQPELTSMHQALAVALDAAPSPFVPHWPHITLARTRHAVLPIEEGPIVVKDLKLDVLTLFSTRPGPEGSIHDPIRSWPIKRTDPTAL